MMLWLIKIEIAQQMISRGLEMDAQDLELIQFQKDLKNVSPSSF